MWGAILTEVVDHHPTARYLLDSNIFRKLACGELKDFEEPLRKAGAYEGTECTLWTSNIALQEIVQHIHQGKANDFEMYREALVWMDDLCGDTGFAGNTRHAIDKAVFDGFDQAPDSAIPNQLRRRIIKTTSFNNLSSNDRTCLAKLSPLLQKDRDSWSDSHQRAYESLRAKGICADRNFDCKAVAEGLFDIIWPEIEEQARDGGTRGASLRPKEEIRSRYREHSYFGVALHRKALSQHGYNFQKHATDYFDQQFCLFAAQGFQLVTVDFRLLKTLKEVQCPFPRVISLADACARLRLGAVPPPTPGA